MNNLENINESLFENIKHINEYGQEYWIARELIQVLGYNEYRFFKKVILKAIDACKASNNEVSDHFVQVHGMGERTPAYRGGSFLLQREQRH